MLSIMLLFFCGSLHAQQLDVPQQPTAKDHVVYIAEGQSIPANKPASLTVKFAVNPGFHINSHTPKTPNLIATKIAIQDDATVNVRTVDFPKGTEYSFAFDPKEKLDVYTGPFALTLHLTAKPGSHTLKAALRYQACDNAACYPPRLLPIEIPFTAR
jgi:DsbC/DsbD-like thiol-disulfide interchange protein